jgi:hypothetical protein
MMQVELFAFRFGGNAGAKTFIFSILNIMLLDDIQTKTNQHDL